MEDKCRYGQLKDGQTIEEYNVKLVGEGFIELVKYDCEPISDEEYEKLWKEIFKDK